MPQVTLNNVSGNLDAIMLVGASSFESADIFSALDGNVDFEFDYILLTLTQTTVETSWEIVKVTSISGPSTINVDRAQEGTPAAEWADGSLVQARVTKGTIDRARNQILRLLLDENGTVLTDENGEILLGPEV